MLELGEIESGLWSNPDEESGKVSENFHVQLLEQYKLCVEMADKISERRGNTNVFFLTFNTAIIGAISAFFKDIPFEASLAFFFAAIIFCAAWGLLLRSYRSLNTAKFAVIGLMEKKLASSPFWAAEWKALGEGRSWRKHIPLSVIETIVPVAFMIVYVYLFILALLNALG